MKTKPILVVGSTGPLSFILQKSVNSIGIDYYTYGRNGLKKSNFHNISELENNLKFSDIIFLSSSLRVAPNVDNLNYYDLPEFHLLLQCFEKFSFDRILYFSSAGSIYGSFSGQIRHEQSELHPISQYGISKAILETIIHKLCFENNKKFVILRISNPVGFYNGILFDYGIVPNIIRTIVYNRKFKLLTDIKNHKDFISIDDLIYCIIFIINHHDTEGTYNISSGYSFSINDLIQIMNHISFKPLDIVDDSSYLKNVDADIGLLDNSKIKLLVGKSFEFSIHEHLNVIYKQLYN